MKKKRERQNLSTEKKPAVQISSDTRRTAVSLVINSLILLVIYYSAMGLGNLTLQYTVMIIYMVCFGGFLIAYIIYNRAFSRKNITPEMLPDTWTDEQKEEYILDGKRRMKKSKWMLTVILPFLVTFIAEALYLFVWKGYLEQLFI